MIHEKELVFQEPNCTSACFNSEHEGLLCLTTADELLIKTENKITFRQKLKNNQRVVGFVANWVYLLSGTEVETIQGKINFRFFLNFVKKTQVVFSIFLFQILVFE